MCDRIPLGEVKFWADFQLSWGARIPCLRAGKYLVEGTDSLSIPGDAPKCFVKFRGCPPGECRSRRQGKWPKFIAKLGSKWYPVESVTEHLTTRVGQTLGVCMAESQLRVIRGQVWFLSRYFLCPEESLTHGIEVYRDQLGQEMVDQIAHERREQEFYTFQTTLAAFRDSFSLYHEAIAERFVEMLAFDALVGNNDRHPANWGVIVSIRQGKPPRFAPVYDSARGLFWNNSELRVRQFLADKMYRQAYIRNSRPQIGWDGVHRVTHIELIRLIAQNYPACRPTLQRFCDPNRIEACRKMIEEEFGGLMSSQRRQAIHLCLTLRHLEFCQAVAQVQVTKGVG
jgi:hypothetical protein